MRLVVASAVQSVYFMGGMLTLALSGVRLHVDQRREVLYIEVEPVYDRSALKLIGEVADSLGFEIMPEWECPPEELPSGAVRHWLAEKEVVDDECFALKAV